MRTTTTFLLVLSIGVIDAHGPPSAIAVANEAAQRFRQLAERLYAEKGSAKGPQDHRSRPLTIRSAGEEEGQVEEEAWKPSIFAPLCKTCTGIPSCPEFDGAVTVPDFLCAPIEQTVQAVKQQLMKGSDCPWDDTARSLVCTTIVKEAVAKCGQEAVKQAETSYTEMTQQSCLTLFTKCTEQVPSIVDIMTTCSAYPAVEDPCEPCWVASCGEASGAVLPKSKCQAIESQVATFSAMLNGPNKPDTCSWDAARKEICGHLFRESIPLCPNPSYNQGTGTVLTKEGCTSIATCRPGTSPAEAEASCAALPSKSLDCAKCDIAGVTPASTGVIVPAATCATAVSKTLEAHDNLGVSGKADCPWSDVSKAMQAQVLAGGISQCGDKASTLVPGAAWTEATCLAFGSSCANAPIDGIEAKCASAEGSPVTLEQILSGMASSPGRDDGDDSRDQDTPRATRATAASSAGTTDTDHSTKINEGTGVHTESDNDKTDANSPNVSHGSHNDRTIAVVAGVTGSLFGVALIVVGSAIVVRRRRCAMQGSDRSEVEIEIQCPDADQGAMQQQQQQV